MKKNEVMKEMRGGKGRQQGNGKGKNREMREEEEALLFPCVIARYFSYACFNFSFNITGFCNSPSINSISFIDIFSTCGFKFFIL